MIAIRLIAIPEQDLASVRRQVRPVGFDDTKCHSVDRQHAILPGRDIDHVDGAVLVGPPARVDETAAVSGRTETQPHERSPGRITSRPVPSAFTTSNAQGSSVGPPQLVPGP